MQNGLRLVKLAPPLMEIAAVVFTVVRMTPPPLAPFGSGGLPVTPPNRPLSPNAKLGAPVPPGWPAPWLTPEALDVMLNRKRGGLAGTGGPGGFGFAFFTGNVAGNGK